MKTHVAILSLLLSGALSAQTLTEKFDSKGHPKAKGVWMTVKYPAGWAAKEGNRPNIVQLFSGKYEGVPTLLIIQIKSTEVDLEGECKILSSKEWEDELTDIPTGMKASNVKKIKHETKPGFIGNTEQVIERAGKVIYSVNEVMSICHGKNLVAAWCGTSAFSNQADQGKVRKNLNALAPLCYQFFNSLVLMDIYR